MAEVKIVDPEIKADNEAEEKFDVGMTEAELLAQTSAWDTESEDFYSALKRIWIENLEYYKGIQTGVQNIRGKQSRAVENRIWMATETMIPIATARLPDTIVKPGADDEQSGIDAQDLQDVLNYQFERVGIQQKAERWMRDMIVKRYGCFRYGWTKDIDDVDVWDIDSKRIRVAKYGKTIDELAFVREEMELSFDSLVTNFGQKTADEIKNEKAPRSEEQVRKNTYVVYLYTTNDYWVYRYGNKIVRKEKNPHYDWKNLEHNFFDRPKKPYVIKSLFETEECIIGDTDYIQQLKSVQDNINIRKRQTEDIIGKVSNPNLAIDSEVMSEEQAANITNEEGFILYGKDAANPNKVRYISPGQVPTGLFDDLVQSRREFDNIWGVHSTTRGEREGRETLGGRQLLREADMGRIDLAARQLERGLDEISEGWTQLIKLFYTEEKTFSILGEDGIRFVKNFIGTKVGKVKPMVKPGSTLKEDESAIQQKAILLWQNKAIGIKTLYKMLKIPDMGAALDDFIETQSGAILAQGQPQGPGEAMIPPGTGVT